MSGSSADPHLSSSETTLRRFARWMLIGIAVPLLILIVLASGPVRSAPVDVAAATVVVFSGGHAMLAP